MGSGTLKKGREKTGWREVCSGILSPMHGGYRYIIIGVALAFPSHADATGTAEKPEAVQSIAASLDRIAATYQNQAKRSEGADKQTESCKPGDDRRHSDLCAQWKAADAAADSAWWAWVSGLVGGGSLLGVILALLLTFHSNWIARDTAKRQLRAYVSYQKLTLSEANMVTRNIQIEWINAGQTPALQSMAQADWRDFPEGLPKDFDFPLAITGDNSGPSTIGPGQRIFCSSDRRFPQWLISRVAQKQTEVILWSAVEYVDVFGEPRRSEFASKLQAELLEDESVGFSWVAINRHNGIDDQCLHPPQKCKKN